MFAVGKRSDARRTQSYRRVFIKHDIKTNEEREMGFLQEGAGKSMQMRLQPGRRVHLMLLSNEPPAGLQAHTETSILFSLHYV